MYQNLLVPNLRRWLWMKKTVLRSETQKKMCRCGVNCKRTLYPHTGSFESDFRTVV